MTQKYNTNEQESFYEGYYEAEEYFNSLDEKDDIDPKEPNDKVLINDKSIRRKRRRTARKAKQHQLKLASSCKHRRHSKYRWNPIWHKRKLSDISPKKLKNRSDNNFAQKTLKEYETSIS